MGAFFYLLPTALRACRNDLQQVFGVSLLGYSAPREVYLIVEGRPCGVEATTWVVLDYPNTLFTLCSSSCGPNGLVT